MKKAVNRILMMVITVLAMTGCGEDTQKPSATVLPTQKSAIETMTIYSINSDTMTLIPVPVKKDEKERTASYIVSLVLTNLGEEDILVNEVKMEGKKAIVSFSSKGKPIKNCNKTMENLILECFANSLLDNVKGCTQVIFRCDGKEYRSSQHNFAINEVYASE